MQRKHWRRNKKKHEKIYKPDPVSKNKSGCLLFIYALHYCKTLADYPSVFGASNSYPNESGTPIYLPLLRVEFTWFHYSRTVLAFCCTCHHLTVQGCYPIRCSLESGLSYLRNKFQKSTDRFSRGLQR